MTITNFWQTHVKIYEVHKSKSMWHVYTSRVMSSLLIQRIRETTAEGSLWILYQLASIKHELEQHGGWSEKKRDREAVQTIKLMTVELLNVTDDLNRMCFTVISALLLLPQGRTSAVKKAQSQKFLLSYLTGGKGPGVNISTAQGATLNLSSRYIQGSLSVLPKDNIWRRKRDKTKQNQSNGVVKSQSKS